MGMKMKRERLQQLLEDSEEMLIKMRHDPQLQTVYSDVNFLRIIEDAKTELSIRDMSFREMTEEEKEMVDLFFS